MIDVEEGASVELTAEMVGRSDQGTHDRGFYPHGVCGRAQQSRMASDGAESLCAGLRESLCQRAAHLESAGLLGKQQLLYLYHHGSQYRRQHELQFAAVLG